MLKLNESEATTLYQYLRYQFIHYENIPMTLLVRKIGDYLQGEMNMADFNLWIDDEEVTIEDIQDILTGKKPGVYEAEELQIEVADEDDELELVHEGPELEIEPDKDDE